MAACEVSKKIDNEEEGNAVVDEDTESQKIDEHGESDDDLLAPASFLYNTKNFQEIRTPEKVKTPLGNDLSPITPLEKVKKHKKTKAKFSFRKLVTEKAAQDEMDKKLAKMDEELKEGIEQGGILDMILKDETKESTDGDVSDDSQDDSDLLPQHRKELQLNIKKMNEGFGNDFPDGFPGDALFIYYPKPADLTTPIFVQDLIDVRNYFAKQKTPSNRVDSLTKEFLMSGALVDMTLFDNNIDSSVMDWLLSCICSSSDYEVIEGAFNAFWAIIKCTKKELSWQFTTDKFWSMLIMMGASADHVFALKPLVDLLPSQNEELLSGNLRSTEDDLSFVFLHSFQTLLKSYSCYIKQHNKNFTTLDLKLNTLLALRLAIALEIDTCSWEIEVLLGCIIECYNEQEWQDEVSSICESSLGITRNHSNKVQLIEVIPVTQRGRELKKLMAFTMLSSLTSNQNVNKEQFGNYLKKSIVPNVLEIISRIRTNQDTDFHRLFSILSFINHCTPEESIVATDKKKLESLISVLRRLNGDIRDPGGYYLNRTKVKDLILRTLNRLSHIASGLHTQSSLDGYFGEATSTFDQLKFETIQDQPDKLDEISDEESDDLSKPKDLSNPTRLSCSSSQDSSVDTLTDEDDILNENPLSD